MNDVLQMIYDNYTGAEREMLVRAYHYAEQAHSGQKRASGEAYFIHPCAVAKILMELGLDCATIAAAFLHDVIEDTPVTEDDIRREFGEEVLRLVSGVTKLDKIVFKSREEEEAENFRKIFVAMAKDIRVIIIKLADRLHNMRSLNFLSKERQLKMAQETLDIYTPLAGRLGISQIKCELEDLCLKYLDPEAYEFLVENIHQKLYERHNFVDFVVKEIKNILDESKIEGEVFGRPKHFYSIYKKMKAQNKTLDQIYDLTAVRVIVGTVDECYEVFGKIHKRWKPIPGRIKDYIATPKANMYQSLHTTVVTNFGQPFEIQIRTFEMHRTAEFGIAAHWKYKEKRAEDTSFTERLSWIREVLDWEGGAFVCESNERRESADGTIDCTVTAREISTLQLGGVSTEEAVDLLARELGVPGAGLLATALVVSHRTGSPLRDLLRRSAALAERQGEFERMLGVKTAQVRLSVRVVCLLPVVMICVLALISPDFQEGLLTPAGTGCVALAVLLDGLALLLIRRLMRGVLRWT